MESYKFSYDLNKTQKQEVYNFYNKIEYYSIDQFYKWSELSDNKKRCYLRYYKENKLIGFCIIKEKLLYGSIQFGPLTSEQDKLPEIIENIYRFYKKKKFGLLKIQLEYLPEKEKKDLFQKLNQKVNLDNKNNWCTKILLLGNDEEKLFMNFSKNHKRSIKKAKKLGFKTSIIRSSDNINSFSNVYQQMYRKRKIKSSLNDVNKTFLNINNIIHEEDIGFILGVFNLKNELMGGVIIIFQGENAFYYYGAAAPEYRKYPVLHLAFYESIKISIKLKKKKFDFGGYNKQGLKQMKGINRFKDGFKPELIEYPEVLNFKLNYFPYYLVTFMRKLNRIKNSIKIK